MRQLIRAYNWKDLRLKHRRYKVSYRNTLHRVGVPEKLYTQLYELRNSFAHGNPIRQSELKPLGKKNMNFSFVQIAPVLFRAALMQRSIEIKKQKRPRNLSILQQYQMHSTFGDDTVNAVLRVAGF